ncbi:MAG TPA: hypothetical protein DEG17_21025 [Cyanobacteria bacterium UBA11149]|nr:hypothetical protein [Cyanobacteria bacterium UBA11367]HBE58959.1 hypothetical protein [Cyanobacteria bacterium UBA11366]HBK64174.1 hypothetical protein [Cyanobacteria bacterium UBA11166]HBS68745.1 hypothetical protein [Cyanobacteria bacterium UBA11153]HBW91273.1 hypothetical protein [Cyanobacteria bacterium UBA11149]HCA95787.1 hypothetical protein [Cyanobacteria bacterium UBA9226]
MRLVYQNEGQSRKFVVTETSDREITDQFIDYETGYLIVEEIGKIDESARSYYYTLIEPKSGEIIVPQERMKQITKEENVTIDEENGWKIITIRTINKKTGSELIHEKLIELSTQKQIRSSTTSAFSPNPRKTIIDSYHESKKQEQKHQDFWSQEYPNKTFEEKQIFWVEYIYRTMRMQGESGYDEYGIFNQASYEEWKAHEPQIDLMLDYVIRTLPFDLTEDEVRSIINQRIDRS